MAIKQSDKKLGKAITLPTRLLLGDTRHNLLHQTKIKYIQLDPFSFCNAKCWFCPVKYQGNPEQEVKTMPVDLLVRILDNIDYERSIPNGLVIGHEKPLGLYTAHYNEVLLYKYFEDMCREFQRRGLSQMILSNGVTLTPGRTDIIARYRSSVAGICLNIPAFTPDVWAERTGFQAKQFDKLVNNVRYATEILPMTVYIQVNGLDRNSLAYTDIGKDTPKFDIDHDLASQVELAKSLFPLAHVYPQNFLIDRNGAIPETILSNKRVINHKKLQSKTGVVTGCSNTVGEGHGRPYDWLHITATGKVILCCDDFSFEYVIGDLSKNKLRDFWGSSHHKTVIDRAYKGLCTACSSAIFG